MNIYIASSYENKALIRVLSKYIKDQFLMNTSKWENLSIDIVSRWISQDYISDLKERAMIDFNDIDRSDVLLSVFPYGRGTASEMGYALAKEKPIIYFCDKQFLTKLTPDGRNVGPLMLGLLNEFSDDLYQDNSFGYIVHNEINLIQCLKILSNKLIS